LSPLIPMFAITGNGDKKCIVAEIENLKSTGFDSVMIYARSGLTAEYMSETWLDICETVIKTAERLNMKVWLYDDYNWPSGSCKHLVEKENSAFIAKRFVYNNKNVSIEQLSPADSGMVFEPFITDLLNPQAVDCFIKLTHQVYFERFGKFFGSVIEGFFTDEPSFVYTAAQNNTFPYYDGVCEDYFNACGRDLKEDILQFFEGNTFETFPSIFYDLVGKRFEKCFFGKLAAWCESHNIKLTGHAMCDDSITSNIKTTGNFLSALNQLSIPGVDNITSENNAFYEFPYACLEALRRNGKDSAMCELFALGPDSMSFAKKANIIWHCAAFGINKFFLAVTHLDARGNIEKNSYFNHFGFANPNFEGMRLLNKEAERAAEFSDKKVKANLNIRYAYNEALSVIGTNKENEFHQNLLRLISFLDKKQICWQLISETEDSFLPTIYPKKDGFKIEHLNTVFTADELEIWIENNIKRDCLILDEFGHTADGVFVRNYTDGSILILDILGKEKRALTLKRQGQEDLAFELQKDGVFTADNNSLFERQSEFCKITPTDLKVSRNGDNLIRCTFNKKGEFHFNLEKETVITVNKRKIEGDSALLLDGEEVKFSGSCTALTHCFNPFYISSAPITLAKGKHSIKMQPENDLAFLPLAVLSGDFDLCESTKNCFFGSLNVSFKINIPKSAKTAFIEDENNLFTRFYVNGQMVDEKIMPPFEFEIPRSTFGKEALVTLTYHSSLSPIFGDSNYVRDLIKIDWCKTCFTTPETVDVSKIKIKIY